MVRFHSLAPQRPVGRVATINTNPRDSLCMGKRRRKAAMGRACYPTFAVTDALGVRGVVPQRNKADPAAIEWFSPRNDKTNHSLRYRTPPRKGSPLGDRLLGDW